MVLPECVTFQFIFCNFHFRVCVSVTVFVCVVLFQIYFTLLLLHDRPNYYNLAFVFLKPFPSIDLLQEDIYMCVGVISSEICRSPRPLPRPAQFANSHTVSSCLNSRWDRFRYAIIDNRFFFVISFVIKLCDKLCWAPA